MVDGNGTDATAAQAAEAMRRSKVGNGDGIDSPISRTGTPSVYNTSLSSFMVDDPYQSGFNGTGEGRAGSPMNGDRSSEGPQTQEQLIAQNSALKTRVSELEVINELFRGRLSQLEQQEAAARHGQEIAGVEQTQLRTQLEAIQETETQLQVQLDDSHRRENNLKRRLDELELELKAAKGITALDSDKPNKRARTEEPDATEGAENGVEENGADVSTEPDAEMTAAAEDE